MKSIMHTCAFYNITRIGYVRKTQPHNRGNTAGLVPVPMHVSPVTVTASPEFKSEPSHIQVGNSTARPSLSLGECRKWRDRAS